MIQQWNNHLSGEKKVKNPNDENDTKQTNTSSTINQLLQEALVIGKQLDIQGQHAKTIP